MLSSPPGLILSENNLILTGYTGPNPPKIGRRVAGYLRMPFIDFEQELEARTGESVETLRAVYGEQRLKAVEEEVMGEVALHRSTVIRISGSALLRSGQSDRLQQSGHIICLVARLDAVLQRLHLALGARYHDPGQRAAALGELEREWGVRGLPGIHELDVTYLNEADTIAAVVTLWQQIAVRRA